MQQAVHDTAASHFDMRKTLREAGFYENCAFDQAV